MTFNLETNHSSFDSPSVECPYQELRKLEKDESGFMNLDNGKEFIQTYRSGSGFALEMGDRIDLFQAKKIVPFETVFLVFVEFSMGINSVAVTWKPVKEFNQSKDYREMWVKKGFHREKK